MTYVSSCGHRHAVSLFCENKLGEPMPRVPCCHGTVLSTNTVYKDILVVYRCLDSVKVIIPNFVIRAKREKAEIIGQNTTVTIFHISRETTVSHLQWCTQFCTRSTSRLHDIATFESWEDLSSFSVYLEHTALLSELCIQWIV